MKKALGKYRIWEPPGPLSPEHPIRGAARSFTEPTAPSLDMHFALELGIVVRGHMQRFWRSYQATLGPGEVWFCGSWEPHGCRVSAAPCEMVFLLVYPPMLINAWFQEAPRFSGMAPFAAPPEQRPQFPGAKMTRALDLARQLKKTLNEKGERARLRLSILLMELLLEATEDWTPPPATHGTAQSVTRINSALTLVFEGSRFVTEEQAARACGMSRKTFTRLFKKLMGVTFAQFAVRYRIGNAAAELAGTGTPIKAVAAHWGFGELSHFYRCFKTHYACTPGEFRRRHER